METGYKIKGRRAKEGAYDTIGTLVEREVDGRTVMVTKDALFDDDYESFEEWVEYTPEELAERRAQEEAARRKAEQEAFLEEAPDRVLCVEMCAAELGALAADASASNEELMLAVAELGAMVASMKE